MQITEHRRARVSCVGEPLALAVDISRDQIEIDSRLKILCFYTFQIPKHLHTNNSTKKCSEIVTAAVVV